MPGTKLDPNPSNTPTSYPPTPPDKAGSIGKYVVFGLIAAVVVVIVWWAVP